MGSHDELKLKFATALPASVSFTFYHVSTTPTSCSALFSPPPRGEPERTYCESHSLLFSLPDKSGNKIAFFAIEILIYTTKQLTTLFVSKADSTGYLHLLKLPRSFSSVVRSLTSIFILHLIQKRHRPDRKVVISLFARAQSAYLFPGSDENKNKHVLDDRALVKWWSKTLDPVLRTYGSEGQHGLDVDDAISSKAYLIVPGHDRYETTAFFPRSARQDDAAKKRWIHGHPLLEIAPHPSAPPRCLVPHFPDDPKSRFLIELDDELKDVPSSQTSFTESPSKRGTGYWSSVKTLEQFWEMMAFRQECSSGRLVGFLWIVFSPPEQDLAFDVLPPSPSLRPKDAFKTTKSKPQSSTKQSLKKPKRPNRMVKRKKPLTGIIIPRMPRIKSALTQSTPSYPMKTKYYYIPEGTQGSIVVDQKAYDRIHDIMLHLDFATQAVAIKSTARWIKEVGIIGGRKGNDWGIEVVGKRSIPEELKETASGPVVNTLLGKRKPPLKSAEESGTQNGEPNVLNAGLVRKKPKVEPVSSAVPEPQPPQVNSLGGLLVRKKPKA